ncbi:MAG: hypothetical protein M5U16_11155 [Hyphomicrobium sp.]|nr:hypothetical protein [Hyphomicrobium sp.]
MATMRIAVTPATVSASCNFPLDVVPASCRAESTRMAAAACRAAPDEPNGTTAAA